MKENLDHSRHNETLRATATNIVIAVAAGSFAVIGYDKCVQASDLPLLCFVFALGLFGALFAGVQSERSARRSLRARLLRVELDKALPALMLQAQLDIADEQHRKDFHLLTRLRLGWFWVSIHFFVSALALVLLTVWRLAPKCGV